MSQEKESAREGTKRIVSFPSAMDVDPGSSTADCSFPSAMDVNPGSSAATPARSAWASLQPMTFAGKRTKKLLGGTRVSSFVHDLQRGKTTFLRGNAYNSNCGNPVVMIAAEQGGTRD